MHVMVVGSSITRGQSRATSPRLFSEDVVVAKKKAAKKAAKKKSAKKKGAKKKAAKKKK